MWPVKIHQMSIKVAQKWFHLKIKDFDTLPKNVGDLGKLVVAIDFEKFPKVQ